MPAARPSRGPRRRASGARPSPEHAVHAPLEAVELHLRALLRPARGVGLVRQRRNRVAELVSGLLYALPDFARVFTHATSSFTDSTVSTGTGGAPRRSTRIPMRRTIVPATAT